MKQKVLEGVIAITSIPIKNNIQKFRESKDLSQEELAEALGVTRTYLSKLDVKECK